MIDTTKIALLIAEKVREVATREGHVPFLTGDLRKSIIVQPDGPGRAMVTSNLPYARAVHDGRPAVTIRPNVKWNPPHGKREHRDMKRARLKFTLGEKTVFARQVRQPPREGTLFIRDATKEVLGGDMRFLSGHVDDKIREQLKRSVKNGRWMHY